MSIHEFKTLELTQESSIVTNQTQDIVNLTWRPYYKVFVYKVNGCERQFISKIELWAKVKNRTDKTFRPLQDSTVKFYVTRCGGGYYESLDTKMQYESGVASRDSSQNKARELQRPCIPDDTHFYLVPGQNIYPGSSKVMIRRFSKVEYEQFYLYVLAGLPSNKLSLKYRVKAESFFPAGKL